MKKFLAGFFCLFIFNFAALSQTSGKLIEENSIRSALLNKDVKYAIYLPADYGVSERAYPVVYLLHGHHDDHASWIQFGEINHYADKAISEGIIPPMIIVMPEADSSWYINAYNGKANYENFFIKEFLPSIEKKYRIRSKKMYRGVAGLSMGGYGSLIYSMKYPELFSAAAALSPAVFADDEMVTMPDDVWEERFGHLLGPGLKGKERLNKSWYNNSILKMVETSPTEKLNKVRYWIDCGDDDFLTKGNCLLHIALTEKKVPHEFRVRNGDHGWPYWRSGITNALQFIGQSFHQED